MNINFSKQSTRNIKKMQKVVMKQLGITQVPEPLKIDNLQKLSKLKIKKMISFCNKKIENLGVKGFD